MYTLPPQPHRAITALVIEDDAHSLFAVSMMLNELNIAFKRNTSGAKAKEQVDGMAASLRFILLDLDLPAADAMALLRQLRRDARTACIPVIAMVQPGAEAAAEQALILGAAAVLIKPFTRAQLAQALANLPPMYDWLPS